MTYTHVQIDPTTLTAEHILRKNADGSVSFVPVDETNSDYQRYLRWLENPNADEMIAAQNEAAPK